MVKILNVKELKHRENTMSNKEKYPHGLHNPYAYKQKVKEWYPEDKPHKRDPYDKRRDEYPKAEYNGWDYCEDDAVIRCPNCDTPSFRRDLDNYMKTDIGKVYQCWYCKSKFTL